MHPRRQPDVPSPEASRNRHQDPIDRRGRRWALQQTPRRSIKLAKGSGHAWNVRLYLKKWPAQLNAAFCRFPEPGGSGVRDPTAYRGTHLYVWLWQSAFSNTVPSCWWRHLARLRMGPQVVVLRNA